MSITESPAATGAGFRGARLGLHVGGRPFRDKTRQRDTLAFRGAVAEGPARKGLPENPSRIGYYCIGSAAGSRRGHGRGLGRGHGLEKVKGKAKRRVKRICEEKS